MRFANIYQLPFSTFLSSINFFLPYPAVYKFCQVNARCQVVSNAEKGIDYIKVIFANAT
jgi:hypothetical protein